MSHPAGTLEFHPDRGDEHVKIGTVSAPDLRAVLFDMDGTLVETEEYWGEAMFELAAALGGRMSDEARAATVGTSMRVAMGILHADLGITRTRAQVRADATAIEERVAELMAGAIVWRPGARELIAAVRAAGVRTALVTTTPRRLADLVLGHITRTFPDGAFDVTVCGDEVPARKPDPAPYRQAMAALGVEPGQCVVVEDSTAGIASGLAAGAAVLGVPTMQAVDPAPGLTLRGGLRGVDVAVLTDVLAARAAVEATA
jgi:HAD superfamily hydrolase (TIGR01509 family)